MPKEKKRKESVPSDPSEDGEENGKEVEVGLGLAIQNILSRPVKGATAVRTG